MLCEGPLQQHSPTAVTACRLARKRLLLLLLLAAACCCFLLLLLLLLQSILRSLLKLQAAVARGRTLQNLRDPGTRRQHASAYKTLRLLGLLLWWLVFGLVWLLLLLLLMLFVDVVLLFVFLKGW